MQRLIAANDCGGFLQWNSSFYKNNISGYFVGCLTDRSDYAFEYFF